MARFVMQRGPSLGAVYELDGDTITIGRGSKSDIIIRDNEVSRSHCQLTRLTDGYEIEDLDSSNGTFVNGTRVVGKWRLYPGSLIELGETITLVYERSEGDVTPDPDRYSAPTEQEIALSEADTAIANHSAAPAQHELSVLIAGGPKAGQRIALRGQEVTVGRDLSNTIVIQDPEVSRFHLCLRRTDRGYTAVDVGSTNGTELNDQPLDDGDAPLLRPDDVLKLGTSVLLQICGEAEPASERDRPGQREVETQPHRMAIDLTPPPRRTTDLHPRLNGGWSHTTPLSNGRNRQQSRLGTGLLPGDLQQHIIVTYAREDWENIVATLTVSLQDAGLKVWVDQYLPPGGADWQEAVDQALAECWLMVAVLSPYALAASHVRTSCRHFVNREKPIIPLLTHPNMGLPVELGRKRPILYEGDNPSRSIQRLIYEIKEFRQKHQP